MTKVYTNRSNARRAALKAGIPADAIGVIEVNGAFVYQDNRQMVVLATENDDVGVVPAAEARDRAKEAANELGCPVMLRDAASDDLIETVNPNKKPKAAKARPANKDKADKKERGPSGMVAVIIELAQRSEGVTRAQLNEVTQWKGAPWKWLLQNPKGTGFADRWGYTLETIKNGRSVTYKLTKAEA